MRNWIAALVCIALTGPALAQNRPPPPAPPQPAYTPPAYREPTMNFAGRQAHVINNAPMLELSGFSIANTFFNSSTRLKTELRWKNVGQVPIIAFEVVLAYFDPFNRRISGPGGVWLVTGRSSGDWNPLAPGASSGDGLIALREQAVMTAFVYVRAVRLQDGTVWYFDPAPVEAEIRRLLPEIREIGNLDPDASTGGR